MNSYSTATGKGFWFYKGHECHIELDYEDDNIKAFHSIKTPNGDSMFADISPYDIDHATVEMWIDLNYPSRKIVHTEQGTNSGPLRRDDLQQMLTLQDGPHDMVIACPYCMSELENIDSEFKPTFMTKKPEYECTSCRAVLDKEQIYVRL